MARAQNVDTLSKLEHSLRRRAGHTDNENVLMTPNETTVTIAMTEDLTPSTADDLTAILAAT